MKQRQQVIKLSALIVLHLKIAPTGIVRFDVSQINQTSIRIMWEVVDCDKRNGRIIEYIVIISNNSNTYNLTSTERYITVNDLVLGGIYNISVAAVNSIGSGPFNYIYVTGIYFTCYICHYTIHISDSISSYFIFINFCGNDHRCTW